MNWGECYYDHFENFLGSPINREVFQQDTKSHSIQILGYDRVFEGCRTFCSLGLTHFASQIQGVGEVFLPTDDGWQDVPYLLANALFFMIQKPILLGWGVSLKGVEHILPDFAKKFNKTAIYFTTPFGLPQDFNKVMCQGELGMIYLAVFISESEHTFFVKHGAEQFEALLASKGVDPFYLGRETCI